jgi:hypothetical protein
MKEKNDFEMQEASEIARNPVRGLTRSTAEQVNLRQDPAPKIPEAFIDRVPSRDHQSSSAGICVQLFVPVRDDPFNMCSSSACLIPAGRASRAGQ